MAARRRAERVEQNSKTVIAAARQVFLAGDYAAAAMDKLTSRRSEISGALHPAVGDARSVLAAQLAVKWHGATGALRQGCAQPMAGGLRR